MPRLYQVIAVVMAFSTTGSAFALTDGPVEEIDEIWVQGERLSKSIVDVEDDFFKLYNKVNKKQDYDIYCGYMSLNRGSMIMTRVCMPAFVTYSIPASYGYSGYGTRMAPTCYGNPGLADGSVYYSGGCFASVDLSPSPAPYYPPSGLQLMERRAEYAQNVLDVINSDQRLLQKYMHLIGLYEDMRQTQSRYQAAVEAGGGPAALRRLSTWRSKGPRAP